MDAPVRTLFGIPVIAATREQARRLCRDVVAADGSCEMRLGLPVSVEPSTDAWQAAFAYLYSRPGGAEYVRSLEAL